MCSAWTALKWRYGVKRRAGFIFGAIRSPISWFFHDGSRLIVLT